ncbi:hypothetical protein Acy02nite_57550 [Actinoplanes cyaneus]|uniref:Uncharacterized protein n=1 Tax=Actinoplanes cyaneus TaxID=52696 RepID=A0A919IL48_9ACTN|nr:hypothetical protein [Actinoplanes cyaneus]GID67874.1 hypothetical protein Acy02nite_57550 [Actinoplanes cyaneus]
MTVARVLGARQVAQALVIAARPSPRVAGLSVLVDAAHASTCVWLAVTSGRWRPTATVDALIAVGLAAAGWQARKAR